MLASEKSLLKSRVVIAQLICVKRFCNHHWYPPASLPQGSADAIDEGQM